MKDFEQEPVEAVDRLVARYLQEQAAHLDTSSLMASVQERWLTARSAPSSAEGLLPGEAPAIGSWASPASDRSATVNRRTRSALWPAAAALAVLLAFAGGRYFSLPSAQAASILRNAHSAHLQGVDRCYQIHFAPDPKFWDGTNVLTGPSDSVLWTRGDRFWADAQIGTVRLTVGRDEEQRLWVSPSRAKGIRFADELADLPEEVVFVCKVNSMSLPALVEDVLADFDLQGQGQPLSSGSTTNVVWATLKPGRSHRLLSAALLEVDAATNVIVRLVLWTVENGEPKGTVTYTLIDSDTLKEDQYRLEWHLDENADIDLRDFGKPAGETPVERK